MHIRVGGFTIRVGWIGPEPPGLRLAASPASVPFLVDPQPADVNVDVETRPVKADAPGECVFDSGGPWRLYRHDHGWLFHFFASTFGERPYKSAWFTPDFASGRVALDREFFAGQSSVDPLDYPLDELLAIGLLAQGRGLEVHACGIVDDRGRGWLFVGQSGAGKSTIARLWTEEPGAVILSDDRVILRQHDGHVWIYGTPWHGEAPLASPARARLDRVFFLRHADRDVLLEVRVADAVARLVTASFPPFHDARAVAFSLEFLESVAARVPCHELGFVPGAAVLAFLRSSASD